MFPISKPKNILVIVGLIILALLFRWGYRQYSVLFSQSTPDKLSDPFLYIPRGTTFDGLVQLLVNQQFIRDSTSFREAAGIRNFDNARIRPGRYKIGENWNNFELIRFLKVGEQATVKLILHNEPNLFKVAGKAARYLETDSQEILQVLNDSAFLAELSLSRENLMTIFIPNTYDFFWSSTPEAFLRRMKIEKDKFWKQNDRLKKAEGLGMTTEEVYTLASIVDRETIAASEKKRVAGLYLNRLKKGIRLQADPTAVFGSGDFEARRVLKWHIEFDSPYNTYLYSGLPPGPICMASISGIDAVLNAEKHDYLYMCAKPDYSGLHAFSKSFSAHQENARRYRRWLSAMGIFK